MKWLLWGIFVLAVAGPVDGAFIILATGIATTHIEMETKP